MLGLVLGGEEPPRSRYALEVVFAAVLEREAGTSDQISDGAGDEDLIGFSCGGDTSGDMNGETGEVVAAHVALTGVKAHPDVDPHVVCGFGDLPGAANRARGPSKVATNPSPVVLISLPRKRRSCSRTARS